MLRSLLAAALIAAALVVPAHAAKPTVYGLPYWGSSQQSSVVEQQSPTECAFPTQTNPYPGDEFCVLNPFGTDSHEPCFWDVDDRGSAMGYGRLLARSYSATRCGVIDDTFRLYGVSLYSSRGDLDVRLAIDPGLSFRIAPEPSSGQWPWRYYGCLILSHTEPVSTATEEIAGSNGGRGVITQAMFSVTSPADQKPRETTSGGAFYARATGGRVDSYCYDPAAIPFHATGGITGGSAYGPGGGQHRYSFTPGSDIIP